jgi:hypothetical protein
MPFEPGKSGNPAGKPKGTRNRATMVAEQLLDGEAGALTRKAIELAKDGDTTALRLCIERILPARKDRPVSFDMPRVEKVRDVLMAVTSIVRAVADGNLTPAEAAELSKVVDGFTRAVELVEIDERLGKLETSKQ